MNALFFHLVFVAVFLAFSGIRAYYHRTATQARGSVIYKEGSLHTALRLIIGIPFIVLLLAYMIRPNLLVWAVFPLPIWLQWVGVALGLASLPLIWWIQWALGSNFSTTLHVRAEHTLVMHGPYRWVRHPMYTVLYIFLIAVVLLTANWFIGGFLLTAQTIIIATRLRHEEAVMIEKFGDEYRAYMQRTGRFLPLLR